MDFSFPPRACADELLEQFLESFPEETAGVQLALVTATVKLFLKKPTEKPQQLIQLVLTYATQVGVPGCAARSCSRAVQLDGGFAKLLDCRTRVGKEQFHMIKRPSCMLARRVPAGDRQSRPA